MAIRSAIEFVVPLKPTPASRPRVTKRGITYYPKAHSQYKDALLKFLRTLKPTLATGLVALELGFVQPNFKTVQRLTSREDVDNLSKIVMDTMSTHGGFWEDDKQIVHLTVWKRFVREGEEPHTQVKMEEINNAEATDRCACRPLHEEG